MESKLVQKGKFCLSLTNKSLKLPNCELGRAIYELCNYVPIPFCTLPRDPSEASKNATSFMVWWTMSHWEAVCSWVAMKQFKSFSINNAPLSLQQMEASETIAKVSIAELNLWAAIFNTLRESQSELNYSSPIQGWFAVQLERKQLDFKYMTKSFGARSLADDWRDVLGCWKDKTGLVPAPQNPFKNHRKDLTAHFNMAEAALSIVRADRDLNPLTRKLRRDFIDKEWADYLDAIQGLINSYRKPRELTEGFQSRGAHPFVEGNQVFIHNETGKKEILLKTSPNKSRLSTRGMKSI
jgi:hypothetical protein